MSNPNGTAERKPVIEVPNTPWAMTEAQVEWLLRGVNGNPSLLDQAGITLEQAVETYGSTAGRFVLDRIQSDLRDARRANKVEVMTGKAVTTDADGQIPFLVRLRMAAADAGGFLADMVVSELDITLARCRPSALDKADRLEVSDAIDYALSMFDATQTPVPPKPVKEKTAPASDGSAQTAYPSA